MEEIIKDNKDYVKVDKSYIVNKNDREYQAALMRRKSSKRLDALENRIKSLESKLNLIIELLSEKE